MARFLEQPQVALKRPNSFDRVFQPPGSKSLTNRALLVAAMARGRSVLRGCLDSEDSQHMREALGRLGVTLRGEPPADMEVEGTGGTLARGGHPSIYVGTAGTAARFLTAALAAGPGTVDVDGSARMRERPMAELLVALRDQGAAVQCTGQEGFLPLTLGPNTAGLRGGEIRLARPASSQFVSALAIGALLAKAPTRIVLEQGTPARPYVDMTLEVIRTFGGQADWVESDVIAVQPGILEGRTYPVEPDASGASYFLGLAAIHGGRAVIDNLGTASLQGDAGFCRVLEQMGARVEQSETRTTVAGSGHLRGVDLDLTDMPDMTLTAAVVALFAEGPTTISGVAILRHHESDRLEAGARELRKLGATVDEREDGLRIEPPPAGPAAGVAIDTYDDHRMAMAFSLAGDVIIREPACSAKTFPSYFEVLDELGMVVG